MNDVEVQLGERSYPIRLVSGESGIGAFVRSRCAGRVALVVGDNNTRTHADTVAASLTEVGFHIERETLPAGEEQKTLTTTARLYDRLAEMRADRKTLVVAIGGGVIGDVTGFAAATFNRGLPLFMVPTTLLAMVDSSVGGKVGVNHARGKNLIGAFYQPVGVWIDTAYLDTLPPREYRAGLAEVVKYGLALDAEFFAYLEAHCEALRHREPDVVRFVVARSCRLKADVVERDERELTGVRAVLNYGHTFGHAIEAVAGYGRWLHGEAVSAGMVCAARLAASRGLIGPDIAERQMRLLTALELPTELEPWPRDALIAAMRSDKKAEAGRLRFVLPVRLGESRLFDDVGEDEVRAALG